MLLATLMGLRNRSKCVCHRFGGSNGLDRSLHNLEPLKQGNHHSVEESVANPPKRVWYTA